MILKHGMKNFVINLILYSVHFLMRIIESPWSCWFYDIVNLGHGRKSISFINSYLALWTVLGISKTVTNLFETLKGEVAYYPERQELQLFESRLKAAFVSHVNPPFPLNLLIFSTKFHYRYFNKRIIFGFDLLIA